MELLDREMFYGIFYVFGRHVIRLSIINIELHKYVHIEAQ